MEAIRKGTRYFDLFDDDLYKWFAEENSPTFEDHLDNLRLQMMACLLFDGSIVVPEQWLVSSPTFGRLAAEIIEPWLSMRDPQNADFDTPPIIPAYFHSESKYADERFLAALSRRLSMEKGSPIRLSPELDTDNPEFVNNSRREKFSEEVSWLLSLSRDALAESHYVERCFFKYIKDPQMAKSVFSIYKCLRRTFPTFVSFDQRSYHNELNSRVGHVFQTIGQQGAAKELDPDLHRGWEQFVRKVLVDKIDLSSITMLRKVLNPTDFNANQRDSIQTMGRYCMHLSLSKMCEGELSTMAYNLYEPTKQGLFEQFPIEKERQQASLHPQNFHSSEGLILVDSLDLLYRKGRGLRSDFDMDWNLVWANFWKFKLDGAYAKDRTQLLARLKKIDITKSSWNSEKWELYQLEEWDRFFQRLSTQLRFVHFELNPKDRRFVNMTTRFPKRTKAVLDVIKNIGYTGAAISEFVHPGFAVPTLVMGGVSALLMAGQGVSSIMSGDRAAAGFELGAEVVRARTHFRKEK